MAGEVGIILQRKPAQERSNVGENTDKRQGGMEDKVTETELLMLNTTMPEVAFSSVTANTLGLSLVCSVLVRDVGQVHGKALRNRCC